MRHSKWHHSGMALVAALVMLIVVAQCVQAPTSDAKQQWQQLNAQVMEAHRAADYAKGVVSAEQALQLARQAFGPRHPNTLTSLNNLAELYTRLKGLAFAASRSAGS